MHGLRQHYSLVTSGWMAGLFALIIGIPLQAQVVRGVVRDARTEAPIPGVIVALDEAASAGAPSDSLRRSSLVLAVLTNERGEYSVQANAAGRWVVSAKMVGMRRFISPPFDLTVGENRKMDITLQAIDFTATLPAVAVTTDAPCSINPRESQRVAMMWEEARAALTATRLALRDQLFRATVVRYQRQLSPQLRILRDDQSIHRGVSERAFVSVAAERLSREGYVMTDRSGEMTFNAPDADVLTSIPFVQDHCFSVSRPDPRRPGLIGLAFQPVTSRRLSGIQGALWLDSTNYALRSVEFRYTKLPEYIRPEHAHGEVRFGQLPNGAWYVSRWFIRMPEYVSEQRTSRVVVPSGVKLLMFREEGGDVTVDGLVGEVRGATLSGRALDSLGRPLRDAVVRLNGTRYSAPVSADGSFRLDSLPGGAYTLRLEQRDYAELGLLAAEQDLEIAEGRPSVTVLSALGSEQVLRRLCNATSFDGDRAAVRVVARDANNVPLADIVVRARYNVFERPDGGKGPAAVRPITEDGRTDENGAAMFCTLPARQQVRYEYTAPEQNRTIYQLYTAPRHSVSTVVLRP